ncbi:MAG TPA: hypothetical protein PKI14_13740 [Fervidobacterium sp.]|uniref:hypothetical protein n=1 Tax=Acetomicrobium mobile TaxID=97477 RepID=UPI0026F03176|nr:hypothetical protein [Acetomicrobium mobile]HUM44002.1 hypothetical protein [Fervidobacterium sp.]
MIEKILYILETMRYFLELLNKHCMKKQQNQKEQNLDRVLIAIYSLGGNGAYSVDLESLQKETGLSKSEIFDAVRAAEQRGLIIDARSMDKPHDWLLNLDGILYTEGLIEKKQKRK